MLTFKTLTTLPQSAENSGFDSSIVLRPMAVLAGEDARRGCDAGIALPLAGGFQAFSACEVLKIEQGAIDAAVATVSQLRDFAATDGSAIAGAVDDGLLRLSADRPPFAGLSLARPRLVGVVNVTPDSFYDGGRYAGTADAIAHGERLLAAGADMLDVGGESTRPGAQPTPEEVEQERVIPVIRALAAKEATVSVDTRRVGTMKAALEAGATVINDVSALSDDPEALPFVAGSDASVILMHKRGAPATMQHDPVYVHAPLEVLSYLQRRVRACLEAGIRCERIAVDPGIGFGKTATHNSAIIAQCALFHASGCAVVIGASRKSYIADVSSGEPANHRLPGSLAAALMAAQNGIQLHRVHDVAETRQVFAVLEGVAD